MVPNVFIYSKKGRVSPLRKSLVHNVGKKIINICDFGKLFKFVSTVPGDLKKKPRWLKEKTTLPVERK